MSASLKGLLHSSQPTERATCTRTSLPESIPNSNSVLWLPLCSTQLYDHSITEDVSILIFSSYEPAKYLRGEAAVLSRSTRAGRPLPESWGPSDKRDEERGVVTLGAGAGRCPGPAAAEVEPRLLRTNGACERASACAMGSSLRSLLKAVCLRY